MKIGKRLKFLRLMLGLNQQQMGAGVISKSFYSKVEREQSEIKVSDLLAILEKHEIALKDFFEDDQADLQKQLLLQSFNIRDTEQINKLIESGCLTDQLKREGELILAILTDNIKDISLNERQMIRKKYLKVGKINSNQINKLRLILPILSMTESALLMEQVFEDYKQKPKNREYLLAIVNICLDYLMKSYQEGKLKETRKTITFINNLPSYSYLGFSKLVAQYYHSLLTKNKTQAKKIVKLLNISGFEQYSHYLPKVKE